MRKVVASEFVSLEGVGGPSRALATSILRRGAGPGDPGSDEGGGRHAGGEGAYEEWAAFFPSQSPEDVPSADYMNETHPSSWSPGSSKGPGVEQLHPTRR
jgi:hypothetical protein